MRDARRLLEESVEVARKARVQILLHDQATPERGFRVAEEPKRDVRPCARKYSFERGQTIVASNVTVLPGARR